MVDVVEKTQCEEIANKICLEYTEYRQPLIWQQFQSIIGKACNGGISAWPYLCF